MLVSLCDCGWLITAVDPISVIHIDSNGMIVWLWEVDYSRGSNLGDPHWTSLIVTVSLCDCGWLITAVDPISVIHVDSDSIIVWLWVVDYSRGSNLCDPHW